MEKWNKKCRFFNEDYACETLSTENYTSCQECKFFQEYSKKILIIKLGAMGDVLRTTPILPLLRKKYGEDILVYWMTNSESVDLLKNNPLIDKILEYNLEGVLRIQNETFDILFSLEINSPATLIASLVKASEKFGYFFNEGSTSCFNSGAEPYLETAFLNHVKMKNKKTYQELISEACDLRQYYSKGYGPIFKLGEEEYRFKKQFMSDNNIRNDRSIIGINIGSASRWPSKFWGNEKTKLLIRRLGDYKIIILAGPNEKEKQRILIEEMKQEGFDLIGNNPTNTISEFAAVVDICDVVICGDTMVLHLASALHKKTIALFFVTSPWEVEDYGIIKKLISPILEKYFYTNDYNLEIENSISVEEVIKTLG